MNQINTNVPRPCWQTFIPVAGCAFVLAALSTPNSIYLFPPAGGFPLLEHLTIGREGADVDFGPGGIDFFDTAPRLRSVEIVLDPNGDINIELFSLPWANLTSFTGTTFSTDGCLFVLARCPILVDCAFSKCTLEDTVAALPLPPITALQFLSVDTSYSLLRFLGALTLPQLETLRARLGTGSRANISLVSRLVVRSGCTLRHFVYSWIDEW
ncbi:hypothetical protein FB451DRAFT_265630 [Mycena latifolia]|nr:hypothetical protein FB451DRAFT_265630 [Mycena latifolia]